MVDLKCDKEDCKFNKCCNCTAKGIDVSNKTECTTYKKSDHPKHQEDKIPQAPVRHNTCVRCTAPCVFENECNCVANGITVQNTNIKQKCNCPACSTFLPK